MIRRHAGTLALMLSLAMGSGLAAAAEVRLYAAGSLRGVMTELAEAWARTGEGTVTATYGASGLLRERIAKGEPADVFASANMEHPQSLATAGKSGPVALFARNTLCALAAPAAAVTGDNLLDRMLDPKLKLGTSTPKADPSGDYAWALFARADAVKPGARAALEAKALALTGGPTSPPPPKEGSVYGLLVAQGQADIFLTYCTNAVTAQKEYPTLQVVTVPAAFSVGADYGLTVLNGAPPAAANFARFVLSSEGRRILAAHGFALPQ